MYPSINNNLILSGVFGLVLSSNVYAFPCYITLVKDSCWTKYDVTLTTINATTNKREVTVSAPRDKSWARELIECQTSEVLLFQATFSPVFWEGDVNKIYLSKSEKSLPTVIAKGAKAWNITMCYPEEFANVPLPPEARGHCKCNLDAIPEVTAPTAASDQTSP